MGIEEFVLDRERRLGEKKGIEKGINLKAKTIVEIIIEKTDFDDAKISTLAGVSLAFVKNIRLNIKK